jgi:hypothetical protein
MSASFSAVCLPGVWCFIVAPIADAVIPRTFSWAPNSTELVNGIYWDAAAASSVGAPAMDAPS